MAFTNLQAGDVLLLYNMPFPIASALIKLVNKSNTSYCDHCATVLLDENDNQLKVYEAQPPKSRKLTIDEYVQQIDKWANEKSSWRLKTNRYLYVEVWRYTSITSQHLHLMWKEAEKWLGTSYSMVMNYLFCTSKIHCSEECGRILMAGELIQFDKEPSKIQPIEIRQSLMKNHWRIVNTYIPR